MSNSVIRQGLRISTLEGVSATVHGTLTTGAFLTGFALYLGASDIQLAIISALPLLAQVFQIPGAWLAVRTGRRKALVGITSVLGRSLWLPIALLPMLAAHHVMGWFLALYAASAVAMNLSSPAWMAWMSELVPSAIRGRYFGLRNRVVGAVTIGASLGAGYLLDAARHGQREGAGFLALQLVALVAGIGAFALILRQPDPARHDRTAPVSGEISWLAPFRNVAFSRVLSFYVYWLFALGVAAPFFAAHLLKNLGWSFKGMAVLATISAAVSLVLNPWWGRALDRYGHRPVMIVSAFGILHVPLYYAFCPVGVVWPIYVNAVVAGIFWSGFNLAMFSLLMYDLPAVGKPFYFALAAALSGVVNFLASLCGGWLAGHMGNTVVTLGGISFNNYQLLFLLTSALRVPGLFLLRRIHEPDAKSSMIMVRQAFIEINRRIGLGRQIFLLPSDSTRNPKPPAKP